MLLIDKYIIKCCDFLDKSIMWVEGLFAPRCKCKKKKDSKRTYKYQKAVKICPLKYGMV